MKKGMSTNDLLNFFVNNNNEKTKQANKQSDSG
jgi:hypothetical protein